MTRAKHDGRGFGGRDPPAHDSPTPVLSLICSCLDLLRVRYVSSGPAADRPAIGQAGAGCSSGAPPPLWSAKALRPPTTAGFSSPPLPFPFPPPRPPSLFHFPSQYS